MIEQAEQFAEEDRKRRELAEELNNADSVCYQAERTLADYGAKIGEDLRQRIEAALREARGAVAARDAAAAKQTAEALKSLLLEVGRTVYSGAQAGAEPHVETAGTHEAGGARVVDAEFKTGVGVTLVPLGANSWPISETITKSSALAVMPIRRRSRMPFGNSR